MSSKPLRQHPISIFLGTLRFIKNSWKELLPVVIIPALSSSKLWVFALSLSIGMVLLLVYRTFYWMRFTYEISEDQLIVKRGVLIRKEIILPKQRIHVVDFKAGIWQQLFNILSVQIKTAGVKGETIELDALHKPLAIQLQRELLDEQRVTDEEKPSESRVIYRTPFADLAWHAATSKTFGFVLFFATYLLSQLEPYLEREEVAALVEESVNVIKSALVLSILLILVVSYTLSFVYNLVRFYDFNIVAHEDDIIVSYGLLEKRRITIPVKKVQAIRIERGLVHQFVGKCRIMIDLAADNQAGEMQTNMLMPNIAYTQVESFLQIFFPEVHLSPSYQPSPPRARSRFMLRTSLFPFFFAIGLFLWFDYDARWFALVLVGIPWGYHRWKMAGWHVNTEFLYTRSQLIAVQEGVIWKRRIQSSSTHQSIFQKWKSLTDIRASVPSGRQAHTYSVLNLADADAESYLEWVRSDRSSPTTEILKT